MELKKYIEYYKSGKIQYVCLIDKFGEWQGEYIEYCMDGSVHRKGFFKNGWFIGKYYIDGKYCFKSFINYRKNITEPEYKKELAMVRLGLIEEPVEFSYLLKDY